MTKAAKKLRRKLNKMQSEHTKRGKLSKAQWDRLEHTPAPIKHRDPDTPYDPLRSIDFTAKTVLDLPFKAALRGCEISEVDSDRRRNQLANRANSSMNVIAPFERVSQRNPLFCNHNG